MLKEKVDLVLAKGATPAEGKWRKNNLNVMIQWFKRDDNKAMPKNKDILLIRYQETHIRVVITYPCEAAATAPVSAAAVAAAWSTRSTHNPSRLTDDPKKFALAAAGYPAAAHAAPVTLDAASNHRAPAAGAIIADVADASAFAFAIAQNPTPISPHSHSHSPPPPPPPLIDWDDAPFDVGIHLDMEAHPMPLFHNKNESENSSYDDDDSISVDLSRD
jgi:hypothetical protein